MANLPIVNLGFKDIQGLRLSWASATTLGVASGQVRNSTNVNDITVSAAVTIDGAVNGANGLDQGSLGNNKLYYVFAIGDSTKYQDGAALISLSASPLLPSGYDMYRRIGRVLTDGSAEFLPFAQYGNGVDREMIYDTPIAELTDGASATFADVDCSSSCPDDALRVFILAAITPSAAGRGVYLRRNGSAATDGETHLSGDVISVERWGEMTVGIDSGAIFEYKVDNASDSVDLYVRGYLDSL